MPKLTLLVSNNIAGGVSQPLLPYMLSQFARHCDIHSVYTENRRLPAIHHQLVCDLRHISTRAINRARLGTLALGGTAIDWMPMLI